MLTHNTSARTSRFDILHGDNSNSSIERSDFDSSFDLDDLEFDLDSDNLILSDVGDLENELDVDEVMEHNYKQNSNWFPDSSNSFRVIDNDDGSMNINSIKQILSESPNGMVSIQYYT